MDKNYLSFANIIQISLSDSPDETIHWHDDLEIILAVQGDVKIQVSFEKINLRENELMVINSAEPHHPDNSKIMRIDLLPLLLKSNYTLYYVRSLFVYWLFYQCNA